VAHHLRLEDAGKFRRTHDAHVIAKFNNAGAINLGKTNMDEFAMGVRAMKPPIWRAKIRGISLRFPAAVPAALPRPWPHACARRRPAPIPAAPSASLRRCAAFRAKPTHGVVSRYGNRVCLQPRSGGPMARSAEDLALMLNVMAGFDERDSTSLQRDKEDYARSLEQPLKGRIACRANFRRGPERRRRPGSGSGDRRIQEAGCDSGGYQPAQLAPVDSCLLRAGPGRGVEQPVALRRRALRPSRCGIRDLADMYESRSQGFGDEVKRRIMIGTYVLSHGYYDAYYLKAQKIRRLIAQDFVEAYKHCDVIMGPTSPTTAFNLGEKGDDPVQMYLSDIYTIAVNLAGLPGMSIPCGFGENGMPVGLQIIGNYFDEARMLNVAHQYQLATDHSRAPKGFEKHLPQRSPIWWVHLETPCNSFDL
jgi:aspartyl-tRNA(Asn)/glutamyl-tRNA(Gln) amidotransferase subunit A